jgi:hypothetical protein
LADPREVAYRKSSAIENFNGIASDMNEISDTGRPLHRSRHRILPPHGPQRMAAVQTSPKELTRLAIEGTFRGKIWQGL